MTDTALQAAEQPIHVLQTELRDGQQVDAPLETLVWLERNFPGLTIADIIKHSPSEFYAFVFNFAWYTIQKQQVRDDVDAIQLRVVALGMKFADEDPYLVANGRIAATLQ